MTPTDLPALRALHEQATKGPWRWNLNRATKNMQLEGTTGARETVMCFERWGMQGAQMIVREFGGDRLGTLSPALDFACDIVGREHHAHWAQTFDHPDLNLIVAMRNALPALLDELERLRALTSTRSTP